MSPNRILAVLVTLLLVLVVAACTPESTSEPAAGNETSLEEIVVEFDAARFSDSTNINNQWLPMKPGSQWVFEGNTVEDGESIPHRLVFTVTDLTKEIEGVETVVAWIEDYSDGELVEGEIAFYAQDNSGNVWYLGEYPEEYEEGEIIDTPAWIAGVEDAEAGIKMPAEPRLGTASFPQGWAPAVEWSDRGQVYRLNQQACVVADCYEDVLIMDEFNEDEPGAIQLKSYARGIGQVQVGFRGEDPQQEELELVEKVMLDAAALAVAREKALELEARAYELSEDVFGGTTPSKAPEGVASIESAPEVYESFDASNFSDSANIDNEWLPMQPGTQWVLEGATVEDGELIPHLLAFTVTDLTKEINGVQTAVAYIEDFANGELIEAEIAFYAQDDDGNVWYLGEYPEEYDKGVFVDAPSWIAGVQGSQPGVKMPAQPELGRASFSQGYGPVVGWTDRGQVYRMDQKNCVPVDCYENVMIMDEFNLEEPGAIQLKFYALGVGQVRVSFRGDDLQPEMLELIELNHLSGNQLDEIREKALALEERAYEISPAVFGDTPPAEGP